MKKLVIFDLDGTLLNTIADLGETTNYALQKNGYSTHPIDCYPLMVGNGVNMLLFRSLPEDVRNMDAALSLKPDFLEYYDDHNMVNTQPYPEIESLLRRLADAGVALAVASNKYERATLKLIRHYFPTVDWAAIEGQTDMRPVKPDPAIVFDILSKTGTAAADALYVGDSGVDMLTAKNAGVESVGVTWGFRLEEEIRENGACHIVHTADEIFHLACPV